MKRQWETWGKWLWEKRLRIIYVIFALVISYYLFKIFVNLSDQLLNIANLKSEEIRNLALAFIGTTSGLGALFGIYLAILRSDENKRQNDVTEQGIITDRINKAVEGLGKSNQNDDPVIEVRIGALFALERIAQDSIRDHIRIIEIICAYIRYNSPEQNETNRIKNPNHNSKIKTKRKKNKEERIDEDIQIALTIIGRRGKGLAGKKRLEKEESEYYQLNLYRCNLYRADFSNAMLSNAILMGSDIRGATFSHANMLNAFLDHADIGGTIFDNTIMDRARFYDAITPEMYAHDCDFSQCEGLTKEQFDVMYCGSGVKIPDTIKTRPSHWPKEKLESHELMYKYGQWLGQV